MSGRKTFVWIAAGLSLILGLLACNISVNGVAPTPATGSPSNTPIISVGPSATETTQAETQTETQAAPTASSTPVPATDPPGASTTPTPQNPLVTTTAYCWSGPADKTLKYELISSIQAGTRVQLLGKGIVDGWWVIRNPRYNDPCWIQQEYVQIDPGYDLSTLKTFVIPWTPTPTP